MHIKQITISNFRSFKQQPEIQPFSNGTNSVVGRNGSGKSNLFDAVQFVLLSPRFYTLRQEERQALLHEGSGNAAMNAFVEIIFDNSDHRFSLENSDEVVIRRTVGTKKDEFFLQRKRTTKQEITSLLEGAGFSKSNPYYMVQQGKIQGLCTMRDHERLNLLKQVAGTTVYDEKKQESLMKMEENIRSIDKISQILKDIDERLHELQGEKDELTQYTKLDRERRCIEYTMYEKELSRARHFLDTIQHQRQEYVIEVSNLHEVAKETHYNIRSVETTLKAKTNTIRRNRTTLQTYQQDYNEVVKNITQMGLNMKELEDTIEQETSTMEQNEKELIKVKKAVQKAETELEETILPNYEEQQNILDQMGHEKTQAERKLDALYAKQARGKAQFNTKEERDHHIRANIAELDQLKSEKQNFLKKQQNKLASLRTSVPSMSSNVEVINNTITEKTKTHTAMKGTIDEKKSQRMELLEERKKQWRKYDTLNENCRELRDSLNTIAMESRKTMPKATSFGLEALSKIVQEERLVMGEQYFGTMMDNFTLRDSKYQTAVEVAAQNSLFHVIVDNDATAARLMKRLEDGRLGRVTFLPLNRLYVDDANAQYPSENVTDVKPLIDICIDYDPKVDRAMKMVFGKKLLARTPEIAAEYSLKCNMDAITLDGDLCSRKGALTGGYVDSNKSRLQSYYSRQEATKKLHVAEKEYYEMKNHTIMALDKEIAALVHETERQEMKFNDMARIIRDHQRELKQTEKKIQNQTKQSDKIEKTVIPNLEKDIIELDNDVGKLKEELGTELISALSPEEKATMSQLKTSIANLGDELESQNNKVYEVSLRKQKLESLLNDNLLKRQRELEEGINSTQNNQDGSDPENIIERKKRELEGKHRERDNLTRLQEDVQAKLNEARKIDEELKAELLASKNELEQLKSHDIKNMKALEEAQDKSEKMLDKRSNYISKRETYTKKIQELGSLPPPTELEKFSGSSISALMKQLEKVNEKLKKYSNVNKKAFDQYVNFSEQRESLLKRKEELDTGADKVKELIENLDRQKDEAINRTFRGVSSHFKDVFKELVPNGAGELIMKTALDEVDDDAGTDDEDDDAPKKRKGGFDPNNPDVTLYRGIGIKVRFSRIGENFLMSQLSGGQKALVALALIFSIQRCDPAPFYLFDELDQALDSSYRSAVANLIERQAHDKENPTQFIVSTFRPELVAVANRCYGISHQNKVSSVHPLSKKDALHFIASLMNEEEAVGEVTTGTSRRSTSSRKRKASIEAGADEDQ